MTLFMGLFYLFYGLALVEEGKSEEEDAVQTTESLARIEPAFPAKSPRLGT